LDPSKGCGPDCIPASVLKHCGPMISEPLCELFNASVHRGIFPDVLKSSYITPIHKSGSRSNVSNYRPVVIQSALSKLFEKLILSKIQPHLLASISPSQHGFIPNRSTITNLVLFETFVTEAFKENSQVDALYLDFSKAFDRVSHKHLLAKLKAFGIVGSLLKWMGSYLHSRKLSVRYGGSQSVEFTALSEVPQGSHLGPLLFNLFINDIETVAESRCLLFADDVKLFRVIKGPNDNRILQEDLARVSEWCHGNSMELNVNKCFSISFSRSRSSIDYCYDLHGTNLPRRNETKDLGVLMDSSLSHARHIDDIVSRARQCLGLVARASLRLSRPGTIKLLYCAYVRSILEYASVVWGPYQVMAAESLQRVQNRVLRLVGVRCGFPYREVPLDEVSSWLGLDSLEVRRGAQDLSFLHKLVNGNIDCPELLELISFRVPGRTRSMDLFIRPHQSTNYSRGSTITRIQRLGNMASAAGVDFFNTSPAVFKCLVLEMLRGAVRT